MKSRMHFAFSTGFPLTGNWHVAILSFSTGFGAWRGGLAGAVVSPSAPFDTPLESWDNAARPAAPARALPVCLRASRRVTWTGLSVESTFMDARIAYFAPHIKNSLVSALGTFPDVPASAVNALHTAGNGGLNATPAVLHLFIFSSVTTCAKALPPL